MSLDASLKQVRDFGRLIDAAVGHEDHVEADRLRAEHAGAAEVTCSAYLDVLEAELGQTVPSLVRCRELMELAFGFARALSEGEGMSPILTAVAERQWLMRERFPLAIGALSRQYDSRIESELKDDKPDFNALKRVVTIASAFAPERADELRAKYEEGVRIHGKHT